MKRKIYPLVLAVLFATASFAQQITINVETAGTLSSLIAESKKDVITDLKLTGELDEQYDMSFIRNMHALEKLDLKNAITYNSAGKAGIISVCCFMNMTSLKHIVLPVNTIEIGDCAFQNCESLETIEFSEVLEKIGYDAFYNCVNLKSLDLPNTLTTIGRGAFYNCTSLKSVVLPNSVAELSTPDDWSKKGCFQQCTSLESIDMSENITVIPEDFAAGCENLKAIIIPDKVGSIMDNAFSNCPNLKDFVIGKKVGYIAFPFRNQIENVVFKCQKIGSRWFKGSTTLQTVTFEKTVQAIEETAFLNCTNLKYVHIPSTISSIGERAFEGCIGLL